MPAPCMTFSIMRSTLRCCLIRLGGGAFARYEGCHQVWRFPLAARAGVCRALEGAEGVRCEVEDLHPVPRAYLEVSFLFCTHAIPALGLPAGPQPHLRRVSASLSGFLSRQGHYLCRPPCPGVQSRFAHGSGSALLIQAVGCYGRSCCRAMQPAACGLVFLKICVAACGA